MHTRVETQKTDVKQLINFILITCSNSTIWDVLDGIRYIVKLISPVSLYFYHGCQKTYRVSKIAGQGSCSPCDGCSCQHHNDGEFVIIHGHSRQDAQGLCTFTCTVEGASVTILKSVSKTVWL